MEGATGYLRHLFQYLSNFPHSLLHIFGCFELQKFGEGDKVLQMEEGSLLVTLVGGVNVCGVGAHDEGGKCSYWFNR